MQITKRIEFDMGHRVPNHKSKCRNPHGHRYACEITMEGDLCEERGSSDEGMVIDFSDIKTIANKLLDGELDHGFMYYKRDPIMVAFFEDSEETAAFKSIPVPFVPTAENISRWIFDKLEPEYKDKYGTGLKLKRIRLYETPNSFADYERA